MEGKLEITDNQTKIDWALHPFIPNTKWFNVAVRKKSHTKSTNLGHDGWNPRHQWVLGIERL